MPSTEHVPVLDFSLYTHGTSIQQAQFCKELRHVFEEWGFAKLTKHLISEETVFQTFAWNKQFFYLPLGTKMKAAHSIHPNPHRGYSYLGQETLSRVSDYEKGILNEEAHRDKKESFDQGSEIDGLYHNVWPEEYDIPGFRQFMVQFYEECHAMHLILLEALAKSFDLPLPFFRLRCEPNTSELRLNYYPSVTQKDLAKGVKRISEHSDFGTITMLFQDTVGGLQVERKDQSNDYVPVEVGRQTDMIINIGDCMQRWTNGRLRSTSHRVVAPEVFPETDLTEEVPERGSIAYFGKPGRDVSVAAFPEFVESGTENKYPEEFTAWEYNQSKLLRTYV